MNTLAGRTFGRYYLLEQIGSGGMASVYLVHDLDRDRRVAMKVLSPLMAQGANFKARFQRETRLLQRLNHPHVVPVLDFGEQEGHHYIVMPYYGGGTLQERFRAGPLTPREGGRLIAQLASALDHAHKQGVVHRDVKPSNVLLDEKGSAYLSDFGFAHVQDASISLTGSALIGTPAYMSPEQCRGEAIDAQSDQYSLGVILYQITTGRLPFEADTPMGLVVKHANAPLPPPRELSPNLPDSVEAVLIKALAKHPVHRFASVADLNRAFQAALDEALDSSGRLKPVAARPRPATRPAAGSPSQTISRTLPLPPPAQQRRMARWMFALVPVLLLPLCYGAWTMTSALDLFGPQPIAAAGPDLQGTIAALSTALANGNGEGLSPEAVSTAIAATLMAAPPEGLSSEDLPAVLAFQETAAAGGPTEEGQPTATLGFGFFTRTPTPAATQSGGSGGPTPSSGGLGPTATRTPTPSSTPPPGATTAAPSNTPPPTATLAPSNTPAPTATRTPTPVPPEPTINPAACQYNKPNNPNYCTPVPPG